MANFLKLFKYKGLIVFNYHRIYKGKLSTFFDHEVFGASLHEFEAQMKWLKNNADLLNEDDLIYYVENNKRFPKRCCLITFDDGYIDNYTLAFPILEYLKIPSIFFIPTLPIENRELGWWDIISYFIKKSRKRNITINSKKIALGDYNEKLAAIKYLLHFKKNASNSISKNLLNTLSAECEVDFPDGNEQSSQLMTWNQLREVNSKNITIGSHTSSHRVLSTIDRDDQLLELKKSKSYLEQKLDCKIRSISYPVGNYSAFSELLS